MANLGHCRLFTSGWLLFFLGLYVSSASSLASLGAPRSPAGRSTGAAPSTSLGVSCSKGFCRRGCDPRLDETKRSMSLPLLILCGRSVLPPRLDASTVPRNIGPHARFRSLVKQRGAAQVREFSSKSSASDVALTSPGSRFHSEKKRKRNWNVEGDKAGVPAGSEDLGKQQFTKRFILRTKDPRRQPQSTKFWPRQTWRNFKLGKKRLTSQVSTVKRPDKRTLSRKNSAPVNDAAPAASPHRWAVFFIGKRPYQ